MPAAKGLFHRAIIQSTLWDTAITALEPHEAAAATELFLSRVGVSATELDTLQLMPSGAAARGPDRGRCRLATSRLRTSR